MKDKPYIPPEHPLAEYAIWMQVALSEIRSGLVVLAFVVALLALVVAACVISDYLGYRERVRQRGLISDLLALAASVNQVTGRTNDRLDGEIKAQIADVPKAVVAEIKNDQTATGESAIFGKATIPRSA